MSVAEGSDTTSIDGSNAGDAADDGNDARAARPTLAELSDRVSKTSAAQAGGKHNRHASFLAAVEEHDTDDSESEDYGFSEGEEEADDLLSNVELFDLSKQDPMVAGEGERLRAEIAQLGPESTDLPALYDKIARLADKNGDGEIDYNEFEAACTGTAEVPGGGAAALLDLWNVFAGARTGNFMTMDDFRQHVIPAMYPPGPPLRTALHPATRCDLVW